MRFFKHILSRASHCRSGDDLHAEMAQMFDGLTNFLGWQFDPDAEFSAAQELVRLAPDALILSGYVRVRLDLPQDRQCSNLQTWRLASMGPGTEPEWAKQALTQLSIVGRVDDFNRSMEN